MDRFLYPACEVELTVLMLNGNFMRPLWTKTLHTSASIPLDYASKGYVDSVLVIPVFWNLSYSVRPGSTKKKENLLDLFHSRARR